MRAGHSAARRYFIPLNTSNQYDWIQVLEMFKVKLKLHMHVHRCTIFMRDGAIFVDER